MNKIRLVGEFILWMVLVVLYPLIMAIYFISWLPLTAYDYFERECHVTYN